MSNYQFEAAEVYSLAIALKKEGYSYRAIEKITGVSRTTINNYVRKFVDPISYEEMNRHIRVKNIRNAASKEGKTIDNSARERALHKELSKENIVNINTRESDAQKIAQLEKELAMMKLKADLYNEIINVAEKQFNIKLLKKAGAKQ